MNSKPLIIFLALICSLVIDSHAQAINDETQKLQATDDWQIDSADVEQINLSVRSTLFLRDNEFSSPMMRGYTLPGFRLSPSISYCPNQYVKAEIGLYLFRFWGTDVYPNMSYSDIAYWTGNDNVTKGFHLLPLFRVQMATRGGLNIILGSIYGGRYHKLIEPLYAPELNLIADPEAGAQILYTNRWLDFDAWVNWESFIYRSDTHQEAFTFGVSSKLKYNRKESPVHLYTPVQILFQHRGGEIDTLLHNSVQTLFNGAAGFGARFNFGHRVFKSLTIEADALVYNQQVGNIWPIDRGWAYYAHAHMNIANVRLKAGYFEAHKFISLFGYPLFGCVSISDPELTFKKTSLAMLGIDYNYEFAPGYTLGASAVAFQQFGATGYRNGIPERFGSSLSYSGTLYFRLNPSFLLKSFKK